MRQNFIKNLSLALLFLVLIGGGVFWYTHEALGITRTWDGGGGNANWDTAANWSGDAAPGTSDIANFDNTCASNCSPTINVAISVAGINMDALYTGTITQSTTNTITVGASNWVQAGGTFTGGTGAITLNGTFTLSGGTFTAGAQTITAYSNWTYTAGTLDSGTSTVLFDPCSVCSLTITGSHTLYNVTFGSGPYYGQTYTVASGTTLTVNGTLTLGATSVSNPNNLNTGTVEVKGNIVQAAASASGSATILINGTGNQTFTGGGSSASLINVNINKPSGTLTLSGTIRTTSNWTYTAGTIDPGTSTVLFDPCSVCSLTITGSHTLYNVTFGSGPYYGQTYTVASGTTLTVNGTLTLGATSVSNPNNLNTGTVEVKGNIVQAAASATGSALINITGPNDQTITSAGTNWPTSTWTINKSSGTVTLASNLTLGTTQALNITSGILSQGASYNLTAGAITIASSGTLLNKGTGDLTLGGTLTNSGLVSLGAGDCGGTDDILIRSSSTGVQRSWNGSGTFRLYDVDIKDMAGSASVTAYTATNTGNNGVNWTFDSSGCPSVPPAATLPTGTFTIPTGIINIR